MANKPRKVETGGDWLGFKAINLSTEDKERYAAWDVHDDDLWVLLADVVNSGYKLSLSFNEKNQTYIAAFTCKDNASPNNGFTISAFAQTWYNALRVLLFKHVVICDYNWTNAPSSVVGEIG